MGSECTGYCNADVTYASWTDYYVWDGSQSIFYGQLYSARIDGFTEYWCESWWDEPTGAWYALSCWGDVPPDILVPRARFTAACIDLTCTLSASATTDPDGYIVSYQWDFGDASTGSGVTAQHTYSRAGSYAVTLTVTDDSGAIGIEYQYVEVPPNTPPVARFTFTCSGLLCRFDGSGSADSDGIYAYAWAFGDGSDASWVTEQHTYNQPGSYQVTLTVTDNRGGTGTDTQTVTVVAAPNAPPIAAFSPTCSGMSCSFDAAGSADSDGTITAYAWTFGDGSTGSGVTAQHTYNQPGSYPVTLTVTDNAGATGLFIDVARVVAPNAVPTPRFTLTCSGMSCSFDAAGSTDSDGTITAYAWTFGDGSTASGVTAAHTYASPGSYPVTLTVTDNAGATATTTRAVPLIGLTARGYKVRGVAQVDLTWTGSGSASVDIYRNGSKITTAAGTSYTDTIGKPSAGRYTYKVCHATLAVCSDPVAVTF